MEVKKRRFMLPNSRVWSHLTTTFIAVIVNVFKDWSCIWFSDKIQDSKVWDLLK